MAEVVEMTFHKFIEDGPGWETLAMEKQFANPHVEVYAAQVRTPSRPEGTGWTVVHRKGAAVVAPMTADGRFILVKQERVPIRATIWEFPAGQIEESEEHDESTIREAALRELREEAGYELAAGGELISLGLFFSSCGFTDEHSHLFLARHVVPCGDGRSPDEHEAITGCRAFSPGELRAMIAGNEIRDANTLSAYARMRAMGIL
jgi:8-oxo-dGTP pyrophosphatase MutT (NUDIX family)